MPRTASGAAACLIFVLSLALLAGRLFFSPPLPLNFLVVFVTMAASGIVALFAVALRHERSLAAFATLVLGVFAAAFLAAETFGGNPPPTTSLDESDNGRTVTVPNGAQLMLQLPGNPTTGYSWEAATSILGVIKESTPPVYKPSGGALGSGGTYTFWYEAVGKGRTELTLVYRRSWETNVAPLKTFKVIIAVQ